MCKTRKGKRPRLQRELCRVVNVLRAAENTAQWKQESVLMVKQVLNLLGRFAKQHGSECRYSRMRDGNGELSQEVVVSLEEMETKCCKGRGSTVITWGMSFRRSATMKNMKLFPVAWRTHKVSQSNSRCFINNLNVRFSETSKSTRFNKRLAQQFTTIRLSNHVWLCCAGYERFWCHFRHSRQLHRL